LPAGHVRAKGKALRRRKGRAGKGPAGCPQRGEFGGAGPRAHKAQPASPETSEAWQIAGGQGEEGFRGIFRDGMKGTEARLNGGGWTGIMQADACAGYNELYKARRRSAPIIEVGCWSHARRKFDEVATPM
jgi:hypothetical protein